MEMLAALLFVTALGIASLGLMFPDHGGVRLLIRAIMFAWLYIALPTIIAVKVF